jgi:hypothetical protein
VYTSHAYIDVDAAPAITPITTTSAAAAAAAAGGRGARGVCSHYHQCSRPSAAARGGTQLTATT